MGPVVRTGGDADRAVWIENAVVVLRSITGGTLFSEFLDSSLAHFIDTTFRCAMTSNRKPAE
jgi:hypothetical protein